MVSALRVMRCHAQLLQLIHLPSFPLRQMRASRDKVITLYAMKQHFVTSTCRLPPHRLVNKQPNMLEGAV